MGYPPFERLSGGIAVLGQPFVKAIRTVAR
jgi:hypothetical protein